MSRIEQITRDLLEKNPGVVCTASQCGNFTPPQLVNRSFTGYEAHLQFAQGVCEFSFNASFLRVHCPADDEPATYAVTSPGPRTMSILTPDEVLTYSMLTTTTTVVLVRDGGDKAGPAQAMSLRYGQVFVLSSSEEALWLVKLSALCVPPFVFATELLSGGYGKAAVMLAGGLIAAGLIRAAMTRPRGRAARRDVTEYADNTDPNAFGEFYYECWEHDGLKKASSVAARKLQRWWRRRTAAARRRRDGVLVLKSVTEVFTEFLLRRMERSKALACKTMLTNFAEVSQVPHRIGWALSVTRVELRLCSNAFRGWAAAGKSPTK